ncbi:MAG TPA: lytic transglycosylase domain-containing protein [Candidatus Acidoferrum sp.]|nr:lytic transglycosylase domain-containing protein [Candidatus Acidoferrum sp.]
MRVRGTFAAMLAFGGLVAMVPAARADYVVLRSGQRLNVTSYELLGGMYRLQLVGGVAEVPASDVVGIEPEEIFASLPAARDTEKIAYAELIRSAARRYGVDQNLIVSVISVESNFNPKAVSRRNARGLMQLLPGTASRLGVRDVFDPKQNIEAGARYLRDLLLRYNNNLVLALAAYNAGPQSVQRYGRVPPYRETVNYVRRIQRDYSRRKSLQSAEPPTFPNEAR